GRWRRGGAGRGSGVRRAMPMASKRLPDRAGSATLEAVRVRPSLRPGLVFTPGLVLGGPAAYDGMLLALLLRSGVMLGAGIARGRRAEPARLGARRAERPLGRRAFRAPSAAGIRRERAGRRLLPRPGSGPVARN